MIFRHAVAACLSHWGVHPAETQPVLADRRDGLHAPGYSGNLLKEVAKRLNTLTFLKFFCCHDFVAAASFFLWSFWRLFSIWTSRGFVRIVRPANRRPGTTLPVFPWSPRCKTGVLPQGAALPPDMPPHAGIFALVQVFFRICLFFQHVRQYPATDLFHLHAAGL